MKLIVRLGLCLLLTMSVSLGTSSGTFAQAADEITLNGEHYKISVINTDDQRIAAVTDEKGHITKAVYDKNTDALQVNGIELAGSDQSYSLNAASHSGNIVLSRKTYTIPASVTTSASLLIAALSAISNYQMAAAVVNTIASGNLFGKPLKTTITQYRTASKYKSGQHKGKYKYWTNVLVKCGSMTVLNGNHSVSFR